MSKYNELSLDEKIIQIAEWIANSKHLVAFTGAGISTESGIPDFRGPDGLWTRRDKGLPPPKMEKSWSEVQPNSGHLALVELQNMGLLKFIISQNVDGLHLISGIKSELLAELHGNSNLMICLSCNKKMTHEESGWDKNKWGAGYRTSLVKESQPTCPHCKGRIISSVVNFGDPLPEEDYWNSQQHSELADVYLIIGSSLVVFPAADLPELARKNAAKMVLINMGQTPYDNLVDIKIEERIGDVITKIVSQVKEYHG